MKLNQKLALASVVILAIFASNAKGIQVKIAYNLGQSTNFINHSFTKDEKAVNQKNELDIFNYNFDNKKNYLCKINQRSISEDWVNLLGRLMILLSFGSIGVMGNSSVIERYIKLIFQNMLPVFLIAFISISLLSLASVIAATSSSVSYQNSCISK
ncbi:MAG: hypothetical protein AAFV71_23035 [Cyanobacteria bacterium J06633_8]